MANSPFDQRYELEDYGQYADAGSNMAPPEPYSPEAVSANLGGTSSTPDPWAVKGTDTPPDLGQNMNPAAGMMTAGAPSAGPVPGAGVQDPRQSPPGSSYQAIKGYTATLDQMRTTVDPAQRSVLQDQLARSVTQDLQRAGHDVKWQGEQLMVDGRPYVLGSGQVQAHGIQGAGESMARGAGGMMAQGHGEVGFETMPTGGEAPITEEPYPYAPHDPVDTETWPDEPEAPIHPGAPGGGGGGPAPGGGGGGGGGGDVPVSTTPEVGGGGGGGGFDTAGGYVPGDIPFDDIPSMTYDELMAEMGPNYVPGEISTGALGPGAEMNEAVESGVLGLLDDPYSINDQILAQQKAESKDSRAGIYQQELDEIAMAEGNLNLGDSRYTDAARRGSRRSMREGIVGDTRTLDLAAASTRKEDERKALALGESYAASKSARTLAEDQQRTDVAQKNIDNMFRSQAERRSSVELASDVRLGQAAATQDRLKLREEMAAKAAEIGVSQDKLMLDYTLGVMADATDRYGINIGAELSRAALAQSSREFKENLIFKYKALAQADAQFAAQLALGYEEEAGRSDRASQAGAEKTYAG